MQSHAQPNRSPIVLVGYGDVARRLAHRLTDHELVAIGRHPADCPAGHQGRWQSVTIDLDDEDHLPAEATPQGAIWIYLAPPPRRGQTDTRLAKWMAEASNPPSGLIYISTTGVYGDRGGNWVDESTPPAPAHDRGHRRLNAEGQCQRYAQANQIPACTLRVTGIYACDRLPVDKVRQGTPVPAGPEAPWSNRIHAEDLSDILRLLIDRIETGHPLTGTFNVSDNQPTPTNVTYRQIAAHFGLPQPPEASLATVLEQASPMAREFLSESRRVDASAIQRALGWTPRYPGLAAALADCPRFD
ncbi:NAD-dependent epimerase/dehydratase family protein [Guyparkeria halophila]|uniref:NAD-dependent epimerase/dehydratase family protein n=1 Tax=Guyparkeria halophila TaxID=47960 RepID=A0ABZ0Z048_9GAMM|nr:NAD-dependent epimerase/dehydratase family protein [Guyparkeria halophila]WQH16811.1 NAD-dependent epimerase/dehydratase family protein [Guyparkeria halophila]